VYFTSSLRITSMRERKLFVEPLEDRRMLTVITVDTLADGIGVSGTTLREAIAAANPDDTINFSVTGLISLSSQLAINKSLRIEGPGANLLTLEAQHIGPVGGFRVMLVDDGDQNNVSVVELSGLKITGGRTMEGNGGGIFSCEDLSLVECEVSGNYAWGLMGFIPGAGGGIFSSSVNQALPAKLAIENCTISENSASILGSPPGVPPNTAGGNGGGIYCGNSELNIVQSTISGNSASPVSRGNYSYSDGRGGGVQATGSVSITNSTITDNYGYFGGGVYAGSATISGSIIAKNNGFFTNIVDVHGVIDAQYSLIGDRGFTNLAESPSGSPDANGNLIGGSVNGFINPQLGLLTNNGGPVRTHALLSGSPARDAGDPSFVPQPNVDQRGTGFARLVGDRIDMGAYEDQSAVLVESADFDGDGDVDGRDFLSWQRGYGLVGAAATLVRGNADFDTDVDGNDLSIWQDQYGETQDIVATLIYNDSSILFPITGLGGSTQTSTIPFEDEDSVYITIEEFATSHAPVDLAFADFAPTVGLVADFGDFVTEREPHHSRAIEQTLVDVL
jgi:CSLREA domain-containing protein